MIVALESRKSTVGPALKKPPTPSRCSAASAAGRSAGPPIASMRSRIGLSGVTPTRFRSSMFMHDAYRSPTLRVFEPAGAFAAADSSTMPRTIFWLSCESLMKRAQLVRSAGIGLFVFQPPVANCAKSLQAGQVGSRLERSNPRAAEARACGESGGTGPLRPN